MSVVAFPGRRVTTGGGGDPQGGDRRAVHVLAILEVAAFVIALILFLVLIAGALERIDHNLATIDAAVKGVNGDTHSLPGQVKRITTSLEGIEADVRPVSGALVKIDGGLATARDGLAVADGHLGSTSGKLAGTESTLVTADGYAHRVDAALIQDEAKLETVSGQADSAIALVNGIHSDAGAIENTLKTVEGHLASIANGLSSP